MYLRFDSDTVSATCTVCNKPQIIPFTIGQEERWHAGEHIQNVIPEVSADLRELLISGICGSCFDGLFTDEEDE